MLMFHVEQQGKIAQLLVDGALRVGCSLREEAVARLLTYVRELRQWNQKMNLTALKEETEIVVTLFIDSLACGQALSPIAKSTILDVGTGAGFPGLPLKVVYPELELTLLEPRVKKTAFLHHMVGTLNLETVTVLSQRIQDIAKTPEHHSRYDRILIRALKMEECLPSLLPLLKPTGQAILCRSHSLDKQDEFFGLRLAREFFYDLPQGFGNRVLSILEPVPASSR